MSPADDTPRTPRTPKAAKGERTRDLLVEAAIQCIGRFGYTAATTELIARHAGLTRGPLQYYFTDRTGLIYEAFLRLQRGIIQRYIDASRDSDTPIQFVDALLDVTYQVCRSEAHYALLEIIVASRSDPALAARLEPQLVQINRQFDARWTQRLAELDATPQQIATARYLAIALNRGLAINSLTFKDPELFEREFAMTRRIAHLMYGTGKEG